MAWRKKGWSVSSYEDRRDPPWHWAVKYNGNVMVTSHRGYTKKAGAIRAFWRLFNVKTLAELEEAYAGSKG